MRYLKMHHNRLRSFRWRSAEINETSLRLQMEKNRSQPRKNTTVISHHVAEGPSTGSSAVPSSPATEQLKSTPQTPRQNKSIRAAHPAIYLNTRSHKLLRKAIRIWKMPIPISNFPGSSKLKVRSFKERVEMLQNQSGGSGSPKLMSHSVRDLQLCSSGTDSSPSPSSSASNSQSSLRRRPVRSRRYRRQLKLYRRLKQANKKLCRLEAAESSRVKGSGCVDEGSDSASGSPPVIRPPPRKTSRRLWRRQLDSSSSDDSPITTNTRSARPHTPAALKKRKNTRTLSSEVN